MTVLKRDYWESDLDRIGRDNGVDGFVTVQARQSLVETETLLDLARRNDRIKGVVGWVDFRSPDVAAQLDRFADHKQLKGLRHVVHDEPDDRFILGEAFNRGIDQLVGRDLVYDVLIFAKHLPATVEFVASHLDIPMVIDHIAKPVINGPEVDPLWRRGIEQLAELPNVTCKVSGVATEVTTDQWDIEIVRPYWDVVLNAFTPDRLMFGSDWPVCLLRSEYDRWLKTVRQLAEPLSADEQEKIFSGTARRVYQLESN